MTDSIPKEKVNIPSPSAPVRDRHGWICTDHRLPPNLDACLIWRRDLGCVQSAEFKMYSANRYEFVHDGDVVSIHSVTHWQSEPMPPDPEMWGHDFMDGKDNV